MSQAHLWLFGVLHGREHVGSDEYGNRYYRGKPRKTPRGERERRFVVYAGEPEASAVPPEWHAWLRHVTDTPPSPDNPLRRPWQRPHMPNPTGTEAAYRPPGHELEGGNRAAATGDYEAWTPPS